MLTIVQDQVPSADRWDASQVLFLVEQNPQDMRFVLIALVFLFNVKEGGERLEEFRGKIEDGSDLCGLELLMFPFLLECFDVHSTQSRESCKC